MKIKHVRKIAIQKEKEYLDLMSKFDYQLFERYNLNNNYDEIRVIRYEEKPYNKELKKLEREYFSYDRSPILPISICSAIIIALVTTFLILNFTLKPFDYSFWFLTLFLPAIVFIIIDALIFVKAFYIDIKNADKYKKRQQEILNQTDELRKNYENKNN